MDTASLGLTCGPSSICSPAALPPSCPRTRRCSGGSASRGAAQTLYQHAQLWEGSCGFLSSQTHLLSFSTVLALTVLPHHRLLRQVSTRDQLHNFLFLHSKAREGCTQEEPLHAPQAAPFYILGKGSLTQMSAFSSASRQLFLSMLWASILEAPQPGDRSLAGIPTRNSFCTLPQLVVRGVDEGSFLSGLPGKMGMALLES